MHFAAHKALLVAQISELSEKYCDLQSSVKRPVYTVPTLARFKTYKNKAD